MTGLWLRMMMHDARRAQLGLPAIGACACMPAGRRDTLRICAMYMNHQSILNCARTAHYGGRLSGAGSEMTCEGLRHRHGPDAHGTIE